MSQTAGHVFQLLLAHQVISRPARLRLCVRISLFLTIDSPLENKQTGFIAPEILASGARFNSDLYSLGATCLFLMTNVHPAEIRVSKPLKEKVVDVSLYLVFVFHFLSPV